jgi:hypothetical protein
MKKQRLPRGWTEKRIRELAAHHDQQTEEEQAAEIEAALTQEDQTLMVVPTHLVFLATKLALNCSCRYAEWEGGVVSRHKPGRWACVDVDRLR